MSGQRSPPERTYRVDTAFQQDLASDFGKTRNVARRGEEIQRWLFETDSTGAFNHLFPLNAVLSLLERTGGVAFSLKEYLPLSPGFGDFK